MMLADGLNDALIGYARREGRILAVYSAEKCIDVLMADGLTYEQAVDHFRFNVEGSWIGRETPVWVFILNASDCEEFGIPMELAQD